MTKHFYNGLKLGVLGGGQLGRMLIQSAFDFNIHCAVLDPDDNAPCKNICHDFVLGSFKDYKTVMDFGKDKDVITIEIEHVNTQALEDLEQQGKQIYPQPHIIKMVQDKGLQKQFYKDNHIPTTDFVFVESQEEIINHTHLFPVFQKSRTQGYDGRGVKLLSSNNDIADALKGKSILEQSANYQKEISVIVARNAMGQIKTFPAVEMEVHPEKNLLSYLISPAELSAETATKAAALATDVAEKTGIVGVLAVEMFLLKTGELLVNEIAPRPHNSGHQTIEGNLTSQYAQHLRAIMGLPLGDTAVKMPSALINLLGEDGFEGAAKYQGVEEILTLSGVYLHLYGKAETKPFRKMGHVTVLGKTVEEVRKTADIVVAKLKVIS
ncbi:MAG: 5-(carboxyamino)imidazole ribonucleotide synthase [Bacteroidetes bacterium]|nr:5-(carboxyamino)imidazole ribonucleotide synthase [Bacteroidota bacterium]